MKQLTTFLLTVFLLSGTHALAQIKFEYLFENINAPNVVFSDSSFLLWTSSGTLDDLAGPLYLFNSNDSMAWNKWLHANNPDEFNLTGATSTTDNGFLFTGDYNYGVSTDSYLQKLSSDGYTDWSIFLYPNEYPQRIITFGNSFLLFHGIFAQYCCRLNQTGDVAWNKNLGIGDGSIGAMALDIQVINNSTFALLISQRVAVYDSAGVLIWNVYVPQTFDPYSLTLTTDGGFLVAGRDLSLTLPMVMKLDSTGMVQWTKDYDYGTSAVRPLELANGNIIIQIDSTNSSTNEVAFIRANSAGEVLSTRKEYFTGSCVGSLYRSPDGSICFAAEVKYFGNFQENTYVLMSDDNFNIPYCFESITAHDSSVNLTITSEAVSSSDLSLYPGSHFFGTLGSVTFSPLKPCLNTGIANTAEHSFFLTPNPAYDYLRVDYPNSKSAFLRLIEPSGKVVYQKDVSNSSNSVIPLNGIPQGMYVVLLDNGMEVKCEKIVIEK